MTDNHVYWQVRRHIDSARRLIDWSNADISFGGDSDPDANVHLKQAYEHLDAARDLIAEHRPAVRYQTVHVGRLVGLDEHAPTVWARIYIEETAATVPVQWARIEEAA